ncbi:hypothetical protein ASG90_00865 [Nocardioides sp. Soil797]|nr:hypothetical protein ASG90_00865 [Nocardioides sp. Soil797]
MKITTLAEAFEFFGTFPDNPRWSWSAVSPDSKTVAVTVWENEVGVDGAVDFFGHAGLADWVSKPGNRERIRNLKVARDHCGGLFHVIWVTARDLNERPWTIAGRYPEERFMMKLIDLNETTGEFSAALIDPGSSDHERRTMADRPTKPPVFTAPTRSGAGQLTRGMSLRETATCPTCFMALPATGVCDNCA